MSTACLYLCCSLLFVSVNQGGSKKDSMINNSFLKHDKHIFNFGFIHEGDVLEHSFKIKNPYSFDLPIVKIKRTCGCTVLKDKLERIPANSEVGVPIKFNTSGKKGNYKTSILIDFGEFGNTEMEICGCIVQELPKKVDMGKFKQGESKTAVFFWNPLETSMSTIQSIEYSKNYFDVFYNDKEKEVCEGYNRLKFLIQTKPVLPFGHFEKKVQFLPDGPNQTNKSVFITGYVYEIIECDIERLFLGIFYDDTKSLKKEFVVYSPYDKEIVVSDIKTDAPNLSAEIKPWKQDKSKVLIVVELKKDDSLTRKFIKQELSIVTKSREFERDFNIKVLAINNAIP